jgi:hypothetical protein
MLRRSFAFLAAATIAAAPVVAQPSAAPLSVAARAGVPAEQGSDLRGGNFVVPAIALIIVILGILTATGVIFDNDHPPTSP